MIEPHEEVGFVRVAGGSSHAAARDGSQLPGAGANVCDHRTGFHLLLARINWDARNPITIAGAFVLPETIVGMIEVSTTRKAATPRTRN
jgi:hypothetical protein